MNMNTGHFHWNPWSALLALTVALTSAASIQAEITPEARTLAEAAAKKLTSAQTLRLTAKHQLNGALIQGALLEKGPLDFTVKRPNQLYVLQRAGENTRELAWDGKTLCVMHPTVKHHAIVPLKAASIEALADAMDQRFGFRPPVAELLSNDLVGQLFVNATSARVVGREWCSWTRCDRLQIVQEGMVGDIWIGVKDHLPRRMLLSFTSLDGNPTWDIRLSKWELDVPVDTNLFSKRPAADSQKVEMVRSKR